MADISTKKQKIDFTKTLSLLIIAARPVHWTKNLALFAALVFSGSMFVPSYYTTSFLAFLVFNLASSATYMFNDIRDAKRDRLHPIKKNRPVASGKLSKKIAFVGSITLFVASIFFAYIIHVLFAFFVFGYLILQIAYSMGLKNIAIIDIIAIATGFVIRVYAGAIVLNVHLSVWFLLCVISAALFLASGKRRAELNIVEKTKASTRKSLSKYKKGLLDSYVTMFGNAAWMSWALFSFFESPRAALPVWLFLAEISKTTTVDKLLMATIPFAIFGIMRYQSLIFEGRSETPEKLFLTDKALLISIAIWAFLVTWVHYGAVSTF